MQDQFENLLRSAIEETGADLERSAAEVAAYMSTRVATLALLVGQVGYEQAVIAERDNVALFAGLRAVEQADAASARIFGLIQGALFFAAGLINPAS